eukprot:TRINITY_DN32524_c0_g1_i1.p1 TRINITY_DN32524_c0_g1~~TRINITY_DN32524_c0_g1_i1.p1  ORF type:complete len:226 (-),score=47.92 TRINITY_DN32524_c0_g1_i1:139-816(-)
MANPRVTYWAGRGRCEPLRCVIAAGGGKIDHVFLSKPAEMASLRSQGKLLYGQVPLVEVDGLNLVQGYPTAQYLAAKYGLYPTDPKEQYLVGHVFAAAGDARGALLGVPFNGDAKGALAECCGPRGLFGRYAPAWEALLAQQDGPFFLGARPSLADVAAFEVLDGFQYWGGAQALQQMLAAFPKLTAMYNATLQLGRLKEWCEVERPQVYVKPDAYARSVRDTLS